MIAITMNSGLAFTDSMDHAVQARAGDHVQFEYPVVLTLYGISFIVATALIQPYTIRFHHYTQQALTSCQ